MADILLNKNFIFFCTKAPIVSTVGAFLCYTEKNIKIDPKGCEIDGKNSIDLSLSRLYGIPAL